MGLFRGEKRKKRYRNPDQQRLINTFKLLGSKVTTLGDVLKNDLTIFDTDPEKLAQFQTLGTDALQELQTALKETNTLLKSYMSKTMDL